MMRRLLLAACAVLFLSCAFAHASDKLHFWDEQQKGANCFNAEIDRDYFAAAHQAGIRLLRLTWSKWKGAGRDFLLGNADAFESIPPADLQRLGEVLDWAAAEDVKVILTPLSLPGLRWRQQNNMRFDDRLWADFKYHEQSAAFWKQLATAMRGHPAVVAYNLINEPAPARALKLELTDRASREAFEKRVAGTAADVNKLYATLIAAVRSVDPDTPIMLDASDFASVDQVAFLQPVRDTRVIYAVHFYEPWTYTNYKQNGGKTAYPGLSTIRPMIEQVDAWAQRHGVKSNRIMLAEFGCDRRVPGVAEYLGDVIRIANGSHWHWAFYGYREDQWDAMDYELGTAKLPWSYWQAIDRGEHPAPPRKDNPLWRVLAREFEPTAAAAASQPS